MGSVGIAIPAYSRGRHLAQTLESVLGQSRVVQEVIVIDDCSPDETGEVARSFAHRGVKHVRNGRNLGVPVNYNESLKRLSTDYVMILEDHDLLEPAFTEKCAGLLDEDPEVTLVGCWIAGIDENSGKTKEVFRPRFNRLEDGRRLAEYLVTHVDAPLGLSTLIRRSALAGLEPWFDQKYWWYADVNLWIQLAQRGKFGYVPEVLLKMRRREHNHFLGDKDWEGLSCCDRIRRDNWSKVFSSGGLGSGLKWAKYAAARDYEAIRVLLSRLARGNRQLPKDADDVLSPIGRLAATMLTAMPTPCARAIRAAHHVLIPRS
jgi:glycosyltransferase involved in cell wall biosynthesis